MRKFFSVVLLVFFCSFAWQLGHQSQGNPVFPILKDKSPCTQNQDRASEPNRKPSAYRLNTINYPKP